jgi:release factor glutamine methyltransferase
LGHAALNLLQGIAAPRVVDVCAGGGNIACAVAMNVPDATIWALDVTPECVVLLRRNIEHLSLQERVVPERSDLFNALEPHTFASTIDLIVANPPYIPSGTLQNEKKDLLTLEPREAFDAGPYGIRIIQKIINEAHPFLRENRALCFEFGAGQHGMVKRLFDRSGQYQNVRFISNEKGIPRVVVAFK